MIFVHSFLKRITSNLNLNTDRLLGLGPFAKLGIFIDSSIMQAKVACLLNPQYGIFTISGPHLGFTFKWQDTVNTQILRQECDKAQKPAAMHVSRFSHRYSPANLVGTLQVEHFEGIRVMTMYKSTFNHIAPLPSTVT